jgi:hypothetical protein
VTNMMTKTNLLFPLAALLAIAGCEDDDPPPTNVARADGGSDAARAEAGSEAGGEVASAAGLCAADEGLMEIATPATCMPDPADYMPRMAASANDMWPACISDNDQYVRFSENTSSLARVGAWEQISRILGFGTAKAPTPQEFTDARVIYLQEQGIESRVSRREDEHYPAIPGKLCRDMTPEEQLMNANRCVGPAKIRPILNAAFMNGMMGIEPALNAARIEGALLWHFYISAFKEATSSADNPLDTDSMWAKYTGGEPRSGGLGLARYVRARSLTTHDRIWDGLLAVRCWRHLDNPTGVAMNLMMRDKARAQLDRALLRGMALIVRQRVQVLPCGTAFETVKILGGMLGREAAARNPEAAAVLKREIEKTDPASVDKPALTAAIDQLFPCP